MEINSHTDKGIAVNPYGQIKAYPFSYADSYPNRGINWHGYICL
jgi:hypothetical protein